MTKAMRWKPKEGRPYWIVIFNEAAKRIWAADDMDERCWQSGNCFETKAAAKAAADKVKDLLLSLH